MPLLLLFVITHYLGKIENKNYQGCFFVKWGDQQSICQTLRQTFPWEPGEQRPPCVPDGQHRQTLPAFDSKTVGRSTESRAHLGPRWAGRSETEMAQRLGRGTSLSQSGHRPCAPRPSLVCTGLDLLLKCGTSLPGAVGCLRGWLEIFEEGVQSRAHCYFSREFVAGGGC